jgi:threonine/homoserine/homoserine lactone efflux protein
MIVGIVTSILGAIPLGATNIAVINTSLKQNLKGALKISLAAGVAEVVLAYYALHCNLIVKNFFDNHQWLQLLIAFLLLIVGGFLFFKSTKADSGLKRFKTSEYITGFVLGLLNPPVLIFWLVAFGIINSYGLDLSTNASLQVLILFFLGVYLGKLFTLYLYSKFSIYIKEKFLNINTLINKLTGSLLFFIGIINMVKFYVV